MPKGPPCGPWRWRGAAPLATPELTCLRLPAWGPADLAAALPAGPRAILDGLTVDGRRCALVAWQPVRRAADLDTALARADEVWLPPGAPPALGAAVGRIAWDGAPDFWLPGAAALFDPEGDALWVRGALPSSVPCLEGDDAPVPVQARPLWNRDGYCAAVEAARRRMRAGELEKVILSVPFAAPCTLPPLTVYRRLTAGAPPGLGFFLADGATTLLGASPEPLVLLAGRQAHLHLLAGTRPAGCGLEQELLSAAKDREEHSVAVEQSRQDLLAVCTPESVQVPAFMQIEQHPGLIHLASHLTGELRPDCSPADLIRACFPAGTVGGVPRAAAADVIAELEPVPRDWYAGAVGALLPGGDAQLWLTIRSLCIKDGVAVVRTGAGLVAESDPASEWQECLNKARRALAALGAEVAPDET